MTRAQSVKDANSVTYQIVRQSAAGPVSIESLGMTLLQPGDLVNIIVGDGEPRELGGSPVPTSSPTASTANDAGLGSEVAEERIGPN
ncbi:MAG: hypothetical protein E5V61_08990 [Mesorhizobium sp.]|nr:MAG: hypothetical protein E5V61_08990 [Mesorhizobium sp.]